MTITPPPDDTDMPPIDTPPEFPETDEPPMRAPGGDEPTIPSEPPIRMPGENPDVETEL